MRPRSVYRSKINWSLIAFAGLAAPALAQQAFYPRVVLTGWPHMDAIADTDESDYTDPTTPFWPGEERLGVLVQVYANTHTGTIQEQADLTAAEVFGEMRLHAKYGLIGTDDTAPRCAIWLHNFGGGPRLIDDDGDPLTKDWKYKELPESPVYLLRSDDFVDADYDNPTPQTPTWSYSPLDEDWPDVSVGDFLNFEERAKTFKILQPWMTVGRAQASQWMTQFAMTLKLHIDTFNDEVTAGLTQGPKVPYPDRFHFDWEERISNTGSSNFAFLLRAIANEDERLLPNGQVGTRWNELPVPGFGTQTMNDLWNLARQDFNPQYPAPPSNPGENPFYGDKPEPLDSHNTAFGTNFSGGWQQYTYNQALGLWYMQICITAQAAAMKEAAYDPIHTVFPYAKCSNYYFNDVSEAVKLNYGWWHDKSDETGTCQEFKYPQSKYHRGWWGAITDTAQHGWRLPVIPGRHDNINNPPITRWLAVTGVADHAYFSSPVLYVVGDDNDSVQNPAGVGNCDPTVPVPSCADPNPNPDLGGHCHYIQGDPYFRPWDNGTGAREYLSRESWYDASDRYHRSVLDSLTETKLLDNGLDPDTGESVRLNPQRYIVPWVPAARITQRDSAATMPNNNITAFYPYPDELHSSLAQLRAKQIPGMIVFHGAPDPDLAYGMLGTWRDVYLQVYNPILDKWAIEWGTGPIMQHDADPDGADVGRARLTDTNRRTPPAPGNYTEPIPHRVTIDAVEDGTPPCINDPECREYKASVTTWWTNIGNGDAELGLERMGDDDIIRLAVEAEVSRTGTDALSYTLIPEIPSATDPDPLDTSVRVLAQVWNRDTEEWDAIKFGDYEYSPDRNDQYTFWAKVEQDTTIPKKWIDSRRMFHLRSSETLGVSRWDRYVSVSGDMVFKLIFESAKPFTVDVDLIQIHAMRDPNNPYVIGPNTVTTPPAQLDPVDDPHYAFIGDEPKEKADLDYNKEVNTNDFAVFMEKYGEENVLADINMDGVVDMQDVVEFTNGYGGASPE